MDTEIREILEAKGGEVHTTTASATVSDAVRQMNQHGIGALVVVDGDQPVGIFTERDVLERVVAQGRSATATQVGRVMTREVVVISPRRTVEQVMKVVTQKRCRHLPVLENGRMVGLISSGDITKWLTRHQAQDIQDLVEYINGPVARSAPPAS